MLFMLFFSYDFNPLSPCRERRVFFVIIAPSGPFQSTLPMRGETVAAVIYLWNTSISIHSPHAGRDPLLWPSTSPSYFNPLSPCGERPRSRHSSARRSPFQSTLPMRGETDIEYRPANAFWNFNPLSPCGERLPCCRYSCQCYFNPLSPCGERPQAMATRRQQ